MTKSENSGQVIAIEEHFMHDKLARHFGPAGNPPEPIRKRLFDFTEIRLQEMQSAGVDHQVLSHQSPGSQRLSETTAVEACKASNDALAKIIQSAPDRFSGFAMLPTSHPNLAADEFKRSVEALGLKGAMIHGQSNGQFVDGPQFEPIYAAAEKLDVPVYLHPSQPNKTICDSYYTPYSDTHPDLLRAAWGFGVETGTQAVRLILSGIFDKHPDLKIVLGHLGEAIPFLLPRIDESLSRPGNQNVAFAEIFKKNFYVTTSGFFSDSALKCCLEVMGKDRVLFAVDWPYADNKKGVTWLQNCPIDDATRARIFYGNARRLLKF